MEGLPNAFKAQSLGALKSIQADEMVVDLDESLEMEVDNENCVKFGWELIHSKG